MKKILLSLFILISVSVYSDEDRASTRRLTSSGSSSYTLPNTYNDDVSEFFGTDSDVGISWDTNGSGDDFWAWRFLESEGAVNIPALHIGDASLTDAAVGTTSDNVTDPSIYLWGDAALVYMRFYNDGTDGVIDVSAGQISLNDSVEIIDNNYIGLGSAAGRIEFDDQATDEVNILNANVGIGTSTPQQALHVDNSSDRNNMVWIGSNSAGQGNLRIGNSAADGTGVAEIQAYLSNSVSILTLNRLGGNIGIETISPGATLDVDPADVTGGTSTESISVRGAAQTIALADGTTRTNQRQFQFIAPTLNGVAGGGTETFTNAATVYISAAPSGTDSTITNPYSLLVDNGDVRLSSDDQSILFGGGSDVDLAYNANGAGDEFLHLRFLESDAQSIPLLVISDASFSAGTQPNNVTDPGIMLFDDAGTVQYSIRATATSLQFLDNGGSNPLNINAATGVTLNASGSATRDVTIQGDTVNTLFSDSSADSLGFSGRRYDTVTSLTIADDGAGSSPAGTVTPVTNYNEINCQDANGCTASVSETNAIEGQDIRIVVISTNTVIISDTAGQTEMVANFTMGQYDNLSFVYEGTTWVETARSNN